VLAGAGLLAAVVSLAVPWGRYVISGSAADVPVRQDGPVAVYQLPYGTGYLVAIGLLAGLLAAAAFGTGRTPRAALTVAPVGGIVAALIVVAVAAHVAAASSDVVAHGVAQLHVTGESAGGVWIGLAAGPLLGFGTGLVAWARDRAGSGDGTQV
jgi:hypothetical protein